MKLVQQIKKSHKVIKIIIIIIHGFYQGIIDVKKICQIK